jgi:hypothetical protein
MDGKRFSFPEMNPGMSGHRARREPSAQRRLLFHFTIFGTAFCISTLYHGMRPIMRLGGMVASGGAYAIAHPAPGWAWIMPVSIMLGMACFALNLFSGAGEGVNLIALAWPGLFLSLGWNFLEFTFAPPGRGIAWGWLVCGVMFVLMGGLPLLLAFRPLREQIRSRLQNGQGLGPYAVQGLLIGLGVLVGIAFFKSVAG